MKNLKVIDRRTEQIFLEKIYFQKMLFFLYKEGFWPALLRFLVSLPFFSRLYGFGQKTSFSKRKIPDFIQKFQIDSSEFAKKVSQFRSFNDFFIRRLKVGSRPISSQPLVLPADARYLVFPSLEGIKSFFVKEKQFNLKQFLQSASLAEKYANGAMVIARLAPVDYHRFHFPCRGSPQEPVKIEGKLFSVHPFALKNSLKIFRENKRVLTEIKTEDFQDILFVEVGATNVGSIKQTFHPFKLYQKGEEKGYFEFGGSTIVLLFEKNKVEFDFDLIENSRKGLETYGLMGDSLGSICQHKT